MTKSVFLERKNGHLKCPTFHGESDKIANPEFGHRDIQVVTEDIVVADNKLDPCLC
jgi:hypothetical protein